MADRHTPGKQATCFLWHASDLSSISYHSGIEFTVGPDNFCSYLFPTQSYKLFHIVSAPVLTTLFINRSLPYPNFYHISRVYYRASVIRKPHWLYYTIISNSGSHCFKLCLRLCQLAGTMQHSTAACIMCISCV